MKDLLQINSLRDSFAVQALSLFHLTEEDVLAFERGEKPNHKLVAKFCYDLAEAMIEEMLDRNYEKESS